MKMIRFDSENIMHVIGWVHYARHLSDSCRIEVIPHSAIWVSEFMILVNHSFKFGSRIYHKSISLVT